MTASEEHKQPLNVLVLSSLFPHAGEPSLGIFVKNRLQELVKDQPVTATVIAPVPWFPFKSKIFGTYGRAAKSPKFESMGDIQIYHPRFFTLPKVGMYINPNSIAYSVLKVARKLLKNGQKFDLIDSHYLYPDGVAAEEVARVLGIPFIMTARGSDVTQIALLPQAGARIQNSIRRAAHVITVSQSLRQKLISLGAPAHKITPLRNGVDLRRFSPVANARQQICEHYGLNSEKPVVLYVGWLIERKRVDIAIATLGALPEVQLMITGTGPLETILKEQAVSLGVQDRVFFTGGQLPEKMPAFFSAADVLILPSEREGWANVLLEAMACGTPVVSHAVDGALELVVTDEAGRLVNEQNPADYAAAISDILAQGIDRVRVRAYASGFDWRSTSQGQYDIFMRAVKNYES